MWPRTELIDLLGITHPIIQAPMAGSTTPALVAAVSNAGGLGSLGCARMPPEEVRKAGETIRGATNKAFNLNFFVHAHPSPEPATTARMRERLAPYYRELGLEEVPEPTAMYPFFDEAMLATLLELRPPIVSFHFGLPDAAAMTAIKDAGILVLCSATTVEDARRMEAAGVDAVIAQGYDAGGHRGTFEPRVDRGNLGTLALVPQIVDAVKMPVIASGGIADGRGIAAAFALGASGVQIGTAFLPCPESGIDPLYRQQLLAAKDDATRLTRVASGRPARALRNRLLDELSADEDAALDFPLQYTLTRPLHVASCQAGSPDFAVMWAGQAVGLSRAMPAAELVETLVEETRAVLKSL